MNLTVQIVAESDVAADPDDELVDDLIELVMRSGPFPTTKDALAAKIRTIVAEEPEAWFGVDAEQITVTVTIDDDEFTDLQDRHTDPQVLAKRPTAGQLALDGTEVAS